MYTNTPPATASRECISPAKGGHGASGANPKALSSWKLTIASLWGQPRLRSLAHGPKTLVDARNRIARVAVDPLVGAVGPPMAPLNLIWSVLLVDLLVFLLILPVDLLIIWDWIACNLIT